MEIIKSTYIGELRTEATHIKSGKTIITDAPVDNNGKGEAFSPTDLVCAALGSCMMTVMGILAKREGIDLGSVAFNISKVMATSPRKIAEIHVDFDMMKVNADPIQQEKLKRAALTCPVALSLDPNIIQEVTFRF